MSQIKKRKRVVLSLVEKLKVLDALKVDKVASVARKFELNESSVREIRKNEEKIRGSVKESGLLCAKTVSVSRDVRVEKTEKSLNIWIEDQTRKRVPLSSHIIREKAKQLHKHFSESIGECCENSQTAQFLASKGWFERFKSRFSLHNVKLVGESASADHEAAAEFPPKLKDVIDEGGYSSEQVFNADESGLFWKRMPSRTFLSTSEKTAPGFKAAKDRLTLLFCANASGFMIKTLVVHKSQNPRALKGKDKNHLPVFWRSNKKAWVTADLFRDWFDNCFVPEVKTYLESKNLPFKALLLIDNAPGHPQIEHQNVKVMFLPANTTSLLQPLDQGVIAAFKAYYVRRTFQLLLKSMDDAPKTTVPLMWKMYNIADCLINVKESIDEVKPSTINACWRKLWPEVVKKKSGEKNLDEMGTSDLEEILEIAHSVESGGFPEIDRHDIEEMIKVHNQELTVDELEDLVRSQNAIAEQSEDEDEDADDPEIKPGFSSKSIDEIFRMATQLADNVLETDPIMDRALRFKRGLQELMLPYKEVKKDLEKKKKQTTITNYFKC